MRIKIRREKLVITLAGIALAGGMVFAILRADSGSQLQESIGEGWINWTEGKVYATGEAALTVGEDNRALARVQAERAATVVAQRNLLEIIKGVRVESETTVENFLLKSDRIRAAVNGTVYGSRPVKVEEDPGGSIKVTVAAPLWGNLSRSLWEEVSVPKSSRREDFWSRIRKISRGADRIKKLFSAWIAGTTAQAAIKKNTGLIIDVSDTEIKPGLFPRVYDEDGNLIIGPDIVNPDIAVNQGMVGYTSTVEAAKDDLKRVGVLPLVTRGKVPVGQRGGIDIMVQDLTLARLKSALEDPNVLKSCRVTVAYKLTF